MIEDKSKLTFTKRAKRNFQGMGCFVELGHFEKKIIKNIRKKGPQRNVLEFFLLDTLKATFLMESLTQRRTQSGHFFQNQGTFIDFQKGTGEASLPPPVVLR